MTGEGLPILVDLVNRGVIRILDLVFVAKGQDGSLGIIALADLDHDGTVDLAVFEGVSSGLVSQEDLADAAPAIAAGSSAAILIFENRWAKPFVQALQRGQAHSSPPATSPRTNLRPHLTRPKAERKPHALAPRYRTHGSHRWNGHCRVEPRFAPPTKSLGTARGPTVRPAAAAAAAGGTATRLRHRRGTWSPNSRISPNSNRRESSPTPNSTPRRRSCWHS